MKRVCQKKMLSKFLKGFTLLELIISMAILAILMLATTQIFASSFTSYTDSKNIESNISNAQFLMNLFAKELRTSTVVSPTTSGPSDFIKFFEYSKSECVQYRFNSTNQSIEVARRSTGGTPDARFNNCNNTSDLTGFKKASSGTVTGSFNVTPSVPITTPGTGRVGSVTMVITIQTSDSNPANMQTTTSLRDYGYIGLQ